MSTNFSASKVLFAQKHPEPGPGALAALAHVLDVYQEHAGSMTVVRVTHDIYGPGVITELTLGDLRDVQAHIKALEGLSSLHTR